VQQKRRYVANQLEHLKTLKSLLFCQGSIDSLFGEHRDAQAMDPGRSVSNRNPGVYGAPTNISHANGRSTSEAGNDD
jgi:hypothetical protein